MKKLIYLPTFILIWLPESLQIKYCKIVWSRKPDAKVLYAYESCNEWITVGVDSITLDAREKMQIYIIPEMDRRGLERPPIRSLESRAHEHLVDVYRRKYPEINFS